MVGNYFQELKVRLWNCEVLDEIRSANTFVIKRLIKGWFKRFRSAFRFERRLFGLITGFTPGDLWRGPPESRRLAADFNHLSNCSTRIGYLDAAFDGFGIIQRISPANWLDRSGLVTMISEPLNYESSRFETSQWKRSNLNRSKPEELWILLGCQKTIRAVI